MTATTIGRTAHGDGTGQNDISYTSGDATSHDGLSPRIVAHVCNDIGLWGAGFVLAVSARWKVAEEQYRAWAGGELRDRSGGVVPFRLGMLQLVRVEPRIWVANMVAQREVRRAPGDRPIRYDALEMALAKLAKRAVDLGASVHMPRIGCGLAGGDWTRIERLITKHLCEQGVPVTVYDWSPSISGRRQRAGKPRPASGSRPRR